jgi:hypothetical protein
MAIDDRLVRVGSMEPAARIEAALALCQQGLTFSEVAAQTGIPIEEIMDAVTAREGDMGLKQFLDACRAIAQRENDPGFLQLAEAAADRVRKSSR